MGGLRSWVSLLSLTAGGAVALACSGSSSTNHAPGDGAGAGGDGARSGSGAQSGNGAQSGSEAGGGESSGGSGGAGGATSGGASGAGEGSGGSGNTAGTVSAGSAGDGDAGDGSVVGGRFPDERLPTSFPIGPSCEATSDANQPTPRPSPCSSGAVCGDGMIGSCQIVTGPACEMGPCTITTVHEECDGSVAATDSCAARGFSGGELACTQCNVDTAGCFVCSNDERVAACGTLDSDAGVRVPWRPVLAPRGDVIGLLSLENHGVRFVRLNRDLELLSSTDCFGRVRSNSAVVEAVALTATSSGWLAAAMTSDPAGSDARGISVYAIDENGNPGAPRFIASEAADPRVVLTSDGTGGALMLTEARVAWLDTDGSEIGSEALPVTGTIEGLSAVTTQAGYLLAADVTTDTDMTIVVWPVAAEPSIVPPPATLATDGVLGIRLQPFGGGALAAWSENPEPQYATLDYDGNVLERLAPPTGAYLLPELAGSGDHAAFLYGSRADGAPTGLALDGIDEDGASLGDAIPVMTSDHVYGPYDMASLSDGGLVVAAVAGDLTGLKQLYLARIDAGW